MTTMIYPVETRVNYIQGDRANVDTGLRPLIDSEGGQYGGGARVKHQVNPVALWTRKEKRRWEYFMRLYKRGDVALMEITFGTTNPDTARALISAEMIADPRLTIQTRRGVVHTSVVQLAKRRAYAAEQKIKT